MLSLLNHTKKHAKIFITSYKLGYLCSIKPTINSRPGELARFKFSAITHITTPSSKFSNDWMACWLAYRNSHLQRRFVNTRDLIRVKPIWRFSIKSLRPRQVCLPCVFDGGPPNFNYWNTRWDNWTMVTQTAFDSSVSLKHNLINERQAYMKCASIYSNRKAGCHELKGN